jgi:hypothetical protein
VESGNPELVDQEELTNQFIRQLAAAAGVESGNPELVDQEELTNQFIRQLAAAVGVGLAGEVEEEC